MGAAPIPISALRTRLAAPVMLANIATYEVYGVDTNNAIKYKSVYFLFPSVYLHYPGPDAGWCCGNDGVCKSCES